MTTYTKHFHRYIQQNRMLDQNAEAISLQQDERALFYLGTIGQEDPDTAVIKDYKSLHS